MARILVVDDLSYIRTLVRRVLEAAGHEVAEAANGRAALAAYRAQPADVVLCDLWMPVMDGLEAIRELRRGWPQVRVVAMSGGGTAEQDTDDSLRSAMGLGAVRALAKPFRPADLVAAVGEALAAPPGDARGPNNPAG
jgi:CheY-like chemotaxis protein